MTAHATTMTDAARGHRAEQWLRVVVLLIAIAALAKLLSGTDLHHVADLIRRAGWPLALVLLPTAVAMGVDSRGWQLILRALGHQIGWPALARARLAVESIVLAAPGGAVAGEAMKAALLRWRAGVPITTGAASLALTKACLWGSESIYLLLASAALVASRGSGTIRAQLPLTVCGAAVVGALSLVAFGMLHEGAWATRLGDRLARLPVARIRRWVTEQRAGLVELESAASAFFAAPLGLRARCVATFTLEWLIEGAETLLILRCIGVPIGVADAFALDGITSLLRAAAFFVPAGLGVQDVTQILLLRGLGIPDASSSAAALIFIKRTKEIFWVFTGSLFFVDRKVT
jgi:uncharacterized protein (TIRG00374 family)